MNQERSSPSGRKGALGFIAAAFIPFLLLLDSALAFSNGWHPNLWLERVVLWTIFLWGFLCLAVLIIPRTRAIYSARSAQLVVMHGTIALLLVVGSLAFSKLTALVEIPYHHRPPNEVRKYHPKMPYIRGIEGESTYTTNSRGIRGSELEPTYSRKILFIGGSTTECMYMDDTEAWPRLCKEQLEKDQGDETVWAGNVGRSGYTTVQHLQYAQQDEAFSKYDTAVFMVGANDLLVWLNFSPMRQVPNWENSGYFAILRTVFGTVWPWTDPMTEDRTGSNHRVRRQWRAEGQIVDTYPPVERMLQQYEQRVVDIIATCRQKNIRPVFITQPTLWMKDRVQPGEADLWTGRIRGSNEFLSIPVLRQLLDRFNAATLSACATHDVPCVDLDSMSGKYEYFYDDFHFTEAGARAVADAATEVLLDISQ